MNLGNADIFIKDGGVQRAYRPKVKINKIYEDAHLPTYGSKCAACADLYAYIGFDDATLVDKDGNRCVMIQPGETVKVSTGLRMAPPEGWYIQGFARSGLSTKHGLAPVNAVPIIDQDYRGEILIPLHNYSNTPQMITHGDRIAQMAIVPYWQGQFDEVDKLDKTERGGNGFGSSGK